MSKTSVRNRPPGITDRLQLRRISIASLILSAIWLSRCVNAETMTLCYEDSSHEPFLTSPAQVAAGRPGILLELITLAAADADIELDWKRRPWKRCQSEVRRGSVDGIFPVIWSPERNKWGGFPVAANGKPDPTLRLWQADYRIFSHPNNKLQWDGEQFSGVINGLTAPLGYIVRDRLREMGVLTKPNLKPHMGLNMVARQRLDGYVLEEVIGRRKLAQLGLEHQVQVLEPVFLQSTLYLLLSKQFVSRYPSLAAAFWQQLANARAAHRQRLLDLYLPIRTDY